MMVAGIWIRGAVALAVSALVLPGCESEKSPSPAPAATGGSETAAEGLPAPVSETRSAILAAAESGD